MKPMRNCEAILKGIAVETVVELVGVATGDVGGTRVERSFAARFLTFTSRGRSVDDCGNKYKIAQQTGQSGTYKGVY